MCLGVLGAGQCCVDRRERFSEGGVPLAVHWGGVYPSVAAAVRAAAHSAPVRGAPVRALLPSIDGWDLPSIRSRTGGGARCYRCVVPQCVFFFGAGVFLGAKIDETSTRSAGTGGGAGCCRGGWFQQCPLESSTCRGPRSRSPRVSNPHTRRPKTTALAIGPSMSLTSFLALPLGGRCSRGGVVLAAVVYPVGVCVWVC